MTGEGQFRVAAIAAIFLVTSVLTGCGDTTTRGDSVTLAQTKAPVQLLRDETASRVPSGAVGAVAGMEDISISCKAKSKDPDGKSRKWKSSTLLEIESSSAWRTGAISEDVVQSFVDDGWKAADGVGGGATVKVLNSETSASQIQLSTTLPESKKDTGSIQVTITGPCVDTDGEDSEEVMKLEKRES